MRKDRIKQIHLRIIRKIIESRGDLMKTIAFYDTKPYDKRFF